MENGPPINPLLMKEGATTTQDSRSEEEEFNKKNNKVTNKDKPQSSIE